MKSDKLILKISAVILVIFVFVQCEKEYFPDDNIDHDHRGDDQPTGCWSGIIDWTGLMSDSLLTINNIPAIPLVDSNYIIWLNDKFNRIDIRSLTSDNFSDLQCLKQYIGSRSLVQLGESCHGTKEYSQIKVRLIKFLHEEMGFDVIAFESGFFECFYTNENIQQFTAITAMKNSIGYSVWGTPELQDLFDYIRSTQSTNRPLILAGFDCQFTSNLNSILQHPSYLFDIISKVDSSIIALQYKVFDMQIIQKMLFGPFSYITQNIDSIKYKYSEIVKYIDDHINEINSAYPQEPEIPQFLKQSIFSIVADLDYILALLQSQPFPLSGTPETMRIRDSAMAANAFFLKEKLYPNKKIMIWAHNYHIANSQFSHALYSDVKVFGNWLHDRYPNELYTIGLYMLRGKTKTDWDWSIMDVQLPVSSNSLEAILYHCRKKSLFVDLLHQNYNSGNKWMFSTITAKISGFANESMIIRNVYDGIIFIDSSSVPTYLP